MLNNIASGGDPRSRGIMLVTRVAKIPNSAWEPLWGVPVFRLEGCCRLVMGIVKRI